MANETMYIVVTDEVLTDKQYTIITETSTVVCSVISFLGMASNSINIRTFIAMGLTDGVTVSFLFLSLFDLCYLMMSFCFGVSLALSIIESQYGFLLALEPYGLFMFFGNIAILINVTNTLTTTFLAVARCMCVARPLHFKNTFSLNKTVVINLGFITFAVVMYTPILANMAMLPRKDIHTNKTRPSLWMSKDREAIKNGVLMVLNTVLPFFTEVVIIICIFVMARSLRAASRFRQTSTLTSENGVHKETEFSQSAKTQNSRTPSSNKSAGKDQRVVQQVILISMAYIVCNTPKILISTFGFIEPQFSVSTNRYRNLYLSFYFLLKCLEIGNASVNTFIYYSYNTKFRYTLHLLFGGKPDK